MTRLSAMTRIRNLLFCMALLAATACSSMQFTRSVDATDPFMRHKEKTLGQVSFGESESAASRNIHIYKQHKGYAFKSPISASTGRSTHAIVAKDKERKWFAGLEWKWSF